MNVMLVAVMERQRKLASAGGWGHPAADSCAVSDGSHYPVCPRRDRRRIAGRAITRVIASLWHWHNQLLLRPPLAGFLVSVATASCLASIPHTAPACLDPVGVPACGQLITCQAPPPDLSQRSPLTRL